MADYNPYWFDPNNLPPEVMQQQVNQMQPLMGQMPQQMLGAPQMPMTIQVPDIQYSDAMKRQARGQGFMEAGLNLLANMKPTALPQSPFASLGQAGLAGLQSYQGNLNNKMAQALEYAKMQKALQGDQRGLNFDTFTDKTGKQWRLGYDPLTGKEISRTEQGMGKENVRDSYKDDAVMTRVVNLFNADPAVRKAEQMDTFSQLIVDVAQSDNPVGHASLETLMARASGEVGNLSEADKKPFGGSRALTEKMRQYFSEIYKGKKTPENLAFISQLAQTFQETGKKKKVSLARERAKQYAKANKGRGWTDKDVFDVLAPGEEFVEQAQPVRKLPVPNSGAPAPSGGRGVAWKRNPQTGKLEMVGQ
jgi:hypothetical protein